MKIHTRESFGKAAKARGSYWSHWQERWKYMLIVAKYLTEWDVDSMLELGCRGVPISTDSDTMDIVGEPTIKHDATVTPWPIEDKRYEAFVATQVWEHLGTSQVFAFKEVMRISRVAILSFPLNWHGSSMPEHNDIDYAVIRKWTCGVNPITIVDVGRPTRSVWIWEFD